MGTAGTLTADALAWVLDRSGNTVVGAYPDASGLELALSAQSAEARAPRAVIVDGDSPEDGLAAAERIRSSHPELKIILLCELLSSAVVRCAMRTRTEGVVLKSDGIDELALAVRNVLEGRSVMPAGWHARSLDAEMDARLATLSEREREVLELAASGLSNKEIAERLVISLNTVKFHLRTIYTRLGVRNRVQAAQALGQGPPTHR